MRVVHHSKKIIKDTISVWLLQYFNSSHFWRENSSVPNPTLQKSLKICNPLCCCTSNSIPHIWAPILTLPFTLQRFSEKKITKKKLPKRMKETRSISDGLYKWPLMINQINVISLENFGKVLVIFKCVENRC